MDSLAVGGAFLILAPLTLLVLYQWVLAVASFAFRPARTASPPTPEVRFLVLIPAHNEEAGITGTLESLAEVDYPASLYQVVVIADRCSDGTATVARGLGARCYERSTGQPGKGAALAWGIEQAGLAGLAFDAIVVVDADTVVDPRLLAAYAEAFAEGHQLQQAHCSLSNPWDTPFTRIAAATSALRSTRYYGGKTALGLSGMLTGTGMCLGVAALGPGGWTAFSVGEDWELSAQLLLRGERIYFNPRARVFARESHTLQEASHQRLRWASGRYAVMSASVWALVLEGVRRRALWLVDAAITVMSPNYSTQATLSLAVLAGLWLSGASGSVAFWWAGAVLLAIAGYYVLGVFSTAAPLKALSGLLLIPVFLPWRLVIEVMGLLGFGRHDWGRMSRRAARTRTLVP